MWVPIVITVFSRWWTIPKKWLFPPSPLQKKINIEAQQIGEHVVVNRQQTKGVAGKKFPACPAKKHYCHPKTKNIHSCHCDDLPVVVMWVLWLIDQDLIWDLQQWGYILRLGDAGDIVSAVVSKVSSCRCECRCRGSGQHSRISANAPRLALAIGFCKFSLLLLITLWKGIWHSVIGIMPSSLSKTFQVVLCQDSSLSDFFSQDFSCIQVVNWENGWRIRIDTSGLKGHSDPCKQCVGTGCCVRQAPRPLPADVAMPMESTLYPAGRKGSPEASSR